MVPFELLGQTSSFGESARPSVEPVWEQKSTHEHDDPPVENRCVPRQEEPRRGFGVHRDADYVHVRLPSCSGEQRCEILLWLICALLLVNAICSVVRCTKA